MDRTERMRLALFTSRWVTAPSPLEYRALLEPSLPKVWLVAGRRREHQPFFRLPAGTRMVVEPVGPARLRIESRLIYPPGPGSTAADYRIELTLDRQALPDQYHSTTPEIRYPVVLDGHQINIGRLETGYLDLSSGTSHWLELMADRDLLVRILALSRSDFLFSEWNAPKGMAEALANPTAMRQRLPDLTASQLTEAARVLAQSKRHLPAALSAVAWLRRMEQGIPEAERRALEGRHLFYRSLLPLEAVAGIERCYFPAPRLLSPAEERMVIAAQEQDADRLSRLPSGWFHRLAAKASLSYRLPPRSTLGWLRLAVDRSLLQGAAHLFLALGDAPPRRLRVEPEAVLPARFWQLDPSQVALQRLGQGGIAGLEGDLPDGPAPLIPAALLELDLPPEVTQLRSGTAPPCSRKILDALTHRGRAAAGRTDWEAALDAWSQGARCARGVAAQEPLLGLAASWGDLSRRAVATCDGGARSRCAFRRRCGAPRCPPPNGT